MLITCRISGSIIVGIKHPDIKHIPSVAKNVIIIWPVTCSVNEPIKYTKAELISINTGIVNISPTMAGPLRDRPNIFMINTAGVATMDIATSCPRAVDIYELSPCNSTGVLLKDKRLEL